MYAFACREGLILHLSYRWKTKPPKKMSSPYRTPNLCKLRNDSVYLGGVRTEAPDW